jgi:hypothetical protein
MVIPCPPDYITPKWHTLVFVVVGHSVVVPLGPFDDPNTSEPCVVDDSFGVPDVV